MAGLIDWFVTDLARPLTDLENAPVYKTNATTALLSCVLSCVVVGACAVFSTIGLSMLFGLILQNSVPASATELFQDSMSEPNSRL